MRNHLDHAGIKKLEFGAGLREHCYETAEWAKWIAITYAPVHRGYYIRKMFARRGNSTRASARYGSDDFKALWIEHGNKTIPRYAPLRRAAKTLRLRMRGEHPL